MGLHVSISDVTVKLVTRVVSLLSVGYSERTVVLGSWPVLTSW